MDVTKDNFLEVLPIVEQALKHCQFYAFDCEMTGLKHTYNDSISYFADMQERYAQVAASAKDFLLCQFGLSAFCWRGGRYEAQTFNFHLFPRPFDGVEERFLSQAGSIQFLSGQGFDFNKMIKQGIPFLQASLRDRKLDEAAAERDSWPITVSKAEDVQFVKELVDEVSGWLQGPHDSMLLPSVNRYYRALQYQQLKTPQFGVQEPPGFFVERVQAPEGLQLQLVRADAEQITALKEQQRQRRLQSIHEAAGFTRVFEMMRDCQRPAVGHNLSYDIAYSLQSFAQPLPHRWQDYKTLVQRWFPGGIWDTKHLACQLPAVFPDSSLANVYATTAARREAVAASSPASSSPPRRRQAHSLPQIVHAQGFDRYEIGSSYAHEAGYDAFMTAAAFGTMLRMFVQHSEMARLLADPAATAQEEPHLSSVQHLRGRLNVGSEVAAGMVADLLLYPGGAPPEQQAAPAGPLDMCRSDLPYATLWGPDPVPARPNVLWVGHLPGSVQAPGSPRALQRQLEEILGAQLRLHLRKGECTNSSTTVLVEFVGLAPDEGAPLLMSAALQQLQFSVPPVQVLTWDDYAAQTQQKQAAAPSLQPTSRPGRFSAPLPSQSRKRQRDGGLSQKGGLSTHTAPANGQADDEEPNTKRQRKSRCTVM